MRYRIFQHGDGLFGFTIEYPAFGTELCTSITRIGFHDETSARFAAQHFGA